MPDQAEIDPDIDDDDESNASSSSSSAAESSAMGSSERDTEEEVSMENPGRSTSLAPARDHSYLEESHPLLPNDRGDVVRRIASRNVETRELAVLELHGVVLFPGCTIPIKLKNPSMIRYLGKQIRLCRTDPLSQPVVRLGILPYESRPTYHDQDHDRSNRFPRDGGIGMRRRRSSSSNTGAQARRGSWMRQRFSFGNRDVSATASSRVLRESLTQLRDEFRFDDDDSEQDDEYEDNDENDDDDENNVPPSRRRRKIPKPPSHPLVGRIGTIATVRHTHERVVVADNNNNNNSNSETSLWGRYEDSPELVFTAVGTSRFRILSCISESQNIFEVKELVEDPLVPPPFVVSLSIPGQHGTMHEQDEEEDDEGTSITTDDDDDSTLSTRLPSPSQRMAWNLSQLTPIPYFVYRHRMPWSLAEQIAEALRTHYGRGMLPSLGEDSTVANRNKLEPMEFSYWMANNAPFSQRDRLELLKMHSVLERLLFIWKAVQKWTIETALNRICCGLCPMTFSSVSDIFVVGGAEGTTSTYVNGAGFIHQITTLREVDENNLTFQGEPSVENTYFPGYSWWITSCRLCGSQLGWKFQKVSSNDRDGGNLDVDTLERPAYFYGFMSSNVVVRSWSTFLSSRSRPRPMNVELSSSSAASS